MHLNNKELLLGIQTKTPNLGVAFWDCGLGHRGLDGGSIFSKSSTSTDSGQPTCIYSCINYYLQVGQPGSYCSGNVLLLFIYLLIKWGVIKFPQPVKLLIFAILIDFITCIFFSHVPF